MIYRDKLFRAKSYEEYLKGEVSELFSEFSEIISIIIDYDKAVIAKLPKDFEDWFHRNHNGIIIGGCNARFTSDYEVELFKPHLEKLYPYLRAYQSYLLAMKIQSELTSQNEKTAKRVKI